MSSKRPSRHNTNGFRPIQAFGQSRNVYVIALQLYESDSTLEQICKRFQMVPGHSSFHKTRKCGSRWFQSELLDDSRWIQSTQNDSERFHKVRISSNRLHFPKRGYRWFQFSLDRFNQYMWCNVWAFCVFLVAKELNQQLSGKRQELSPPGFNSLFSSFCWGTIYKM